MWDEKDIPTPVEGYEAGGAVFAEFDIERSHVRLECQPRGGIILAYMVNLGAVGEQSSSRNVTIIWKYGRVEGRKAIRIAIA